ncbi:hypothetical protein P43SY_000400 [Pythium insidiosum]|uniref:Uncharacterized protein n=1 Tax=Pythium insidiosum TaxID=114742 RepID=A0AAD5QDF2_PYTIN|nr:hypothetical protein P43SY_000400 [Pythium insidiosum]
MSLSFALPADMLERLQKSSSSSRAPALSTAAAPTAQPAANHEPEEPSDFDSWESRDFDSPVPQPDDPAVASPSPSAAASLRVLGDDDWLEDAEAPELGDDFPVLVVDLTRLRDEHLGVDVAADVALDSDEALRAFYHQVKGVLHAHWTHLTDALFEQQIAVHTTYGQHRATLAALHRTAPTHVLALVDYPVELAGLALHEYLHVLSAPTRWPSVNALKDCLRRCSRDLEWKFEIALELERLATDEHARCQRERDALSAEIDDLVRLRDSFRAKLEATATSSTRYLLLRKLEDLERRLTGRLDVFLAEPEAAKLTDREVRELEQFFRGSATETEAAPARQLQNVLDMVIAMILSRLPWDVGTQPTQEAHFELLLERHLHLRQLWKRDFGRLPKRKNADGEEEQPDEEEEEEEEEEELLDEQEEALAENWELLQDEAEADAIEPTVDDETVERKQEQVERDSDAQERQRPMSDPATADGYSGDYESDESEVEEAAALRTPLRTDPVARRRRVRVGAEKQKKKKSSEELKASAVATDNERKQKKEKKEKKKKDKRNDISDEVGEQESEKKKTKKKKKSKKSKLKTQKEPKEDEFFQPFACTGALGLLRLAKENEMF